MNLEDMIRSSAGEQGKRYRPPEDLDARVGRRRRQRAARRVAAAGAAAGVMLVGGALLLSNPLGESDRTVPAAQPTAAGVVESTETARTLATTPDRTPTTTTPPTTTVAAATQPPATTAPSTAPPATAPPTTLHPATPPPYASAGGVWTFGEFWNVPQLGSEHQVRGTGCGGSTIIPDVIPDGLWAAYITSHDDTHVGLDLLCIYAVADASALPNPDATVVLDEPNYVIVNNQTRARPMPLHPDIVLRLGTRTGDGRCVDGVPTVLWSDLPADRQTWVRIHEGRVTWVFADCAPS